MRGDFYLDGWRIQPQLNLISISDHVVRIEPKAMLVLVCLSLHQDEVLTKQAIKKEVWPNTFVTDHVLIRCVSDLRKAFQDDPRSPRIVQTISRGGYRLIPSVVRAEESPLPALGDDLESRGEESTVDPVIHTPPGAKPRRKWILLAFAMSGLLLLLLGAVAGLTSSRWATASRVLKTALTSNRPVSNKTTVEPKAYEAYLKGRHLSNRVSRESLTQAVVYFRRAIALDSHFALAHAGLADALGLMAQHGIENPDRCYHLSKAAALRALELDQSAPEPRASLALAIMCHDLNWLSAERGFREAIGMNPRYPSARYWLALCLLAQGRMEEAVSEAETARALDPVSPVFPVMLARALAVGGRYEEASQTCLDSLELDPSDRSVRLLLAECYWRLGRREEATATLATISSAGEEYKRQLEILSAVFDGKPEGGRRMLKALESSAEADRDPAFWARVSAILGENDLAFGWLEKAFGRRETAVLLLKVDPAYTGLRNDARFDPLVARLGLRAKEE